MSFFTGYLHLRSVFQLFFKFPQQNGVELNIFIYYLNLLIDFLFVIVYMVTLFFFLLIYIFFIILLSKLNFIKATLLLVWCTQFKTILRNCIKES